MKARGTAPGPPMSLSPNVAPTWSPGPRGAWLCREDQLLAWSGRAWRDGGQVHTRALCCLLAFASEGETEEMLNISAGNTWNKTPTVGYDADSTGGARSTIPDPTRPEILSRSLPSFTSGSVSSATEIRKKPLSSRLAWLLERWQREKTLEQDSAFRG